MRRSARCTTIRVLSILLLGGLVCATSAWAEDEEMPVAPGEEGTPMPPGDEGQPNQPMQPPGAMQGEAPVTPAATTDGSMPGMLAPGTHPFFASLSLGGGIKLSKSLGQFKLVQEFGWHVLSGNFTGLAVGLALGESFGDSVLNFQLAPKVWWHFMPIAALGFYVGPFVQFGFTHTSIDVAGVSASDTNFNWQIGVDGVLMIGDRFFVLFRPFGLDVTHASGNTGFRWDLQLGGGVAF